MYILDTLWGVCFSITMRIAEINEHEFNQIYRAYTDMVYAMEPVSPEQLNRCNDVDQVLQIVADRLFHSSADK